MYINLYTAQQLQSLKDRLLWIGLFLACGGGASLIYNILLLENTRWFWVLSTLPVLCLGVLLVLFSAGFISLKSVYVAITPLRISYRIHFLSSECHISWDEVTDIQVSQHCVLFNLAGGGQKMLNLTAISSHNVASRVAGGVHSAALARNLRVNSFHAPLPGATHNM